MRPYQAFQFPKSTAAAAPAIPATLNANANTIQWDSTGIQAVASFSVNADGSCGGADFFGPGSWITPVGGSYGSSYWVKVDITTGSVTTGTTGSRVALTSGATWTVVTTGTAAYRTKSASGTIEIWDAAAAGNLKASGTFSLSAVASNNSDPGDGGG
jgi:hypothetical protein